MSLPKGVYKHFKGNLYRLIEVARHSETQEEFVVYQALYGEHGFWVRPLTMFDETIERNGKVMKRFQYMSEHLAE